MKRLPRISYANVVATLALVLAIGGTSYAAITINGTTAADRTLFCSTDWRGAVLGHFSSRTAAKNRRRDATPEV